MQRAKADDAENKKIAEYEESIVKIGGEPLFLLLAFLFGGRSPNIIYDKNVTNTILTSAY